jgi:hypothetical protein
MNKTTPIINDSAKETLEQINELLCIGHAGEAAVMLGEFLDYVKTSKPHAVTSCPPVNNLAIRNAEEVEWLLNHFMQLPKVLSY